MTNNIWWLSVSWKFVIDCCRWFSQCRWCGSRKKRWTGRQASLECHRKNQHNSSSKKKHQFDSGAEQSVCLFHFSRVRSAQLKSFNIPTRQWKNNSNIEFTINKTNWQSYVERWLPAWNYYFITVESSLRWSDEKLISDSVIPSICSWERKKNKAEKRELNRQLSANEGSSHNRQLIRACFAHLFFNFARKRSQCSAKMMNFSWIFRVPR